MNDNFNEVIKNARRDKGLTQEELAIRLNVSRQTIGNWESGRVYPDSKVIKQLCDVLNIRLDALKNEDIYEVFKVNELVRDKEIRLKKWTFIIVMILAVVIVLINFTINIVRNSNMYQLYNVTIDSEQFELNDCIFFYSKDKIYFQFGSLISHDLETDEDTTYGVELYQQIGNDIITKYEAIYTEDLFIFEDYRRNEIFDKNFYKNLNKTYLKIKFYNTEDILETITIKLEFKLNFESNLLTYLENNSVISNTKKFESKGLIDVDTLTKNGYVFNADTRNYEYILKNGIFKFDINNYTLNYFSNSDNSNVYINYNIKNNLIVVKSYDVLLDFKISFKYNIITDYLSCASINCNNYQTYINLILSEYEKLK